jgi:hypothetical protein
MARVIVEIRWGRSASRKAVIEPGAVLRVGRSDRADLAVGHDARMSALHFALSWDGAVCRVDDLESLSGITLNGERVSGGVIANGDWIFAGETVFSIYLEGATPPRDPAPRPTPETEAALAALREEGDGLHAVLDGSKGARVTELLHEGVEPYRSLYDGAQGDALAEVAPYLVRFVAGSGLLERVVTEGWGRRWGIFLVSRRPFDEVRRHLRRFLMVEDDETGEKVYFRFYDPATLRIFVPTCTTRQAAQLFGEGEIERFLVEDEASALARFAPDGAR